MSTKYQLIKTFAGIHTDSVNGARVSPDGRYLASISRDGSVATYDLVGGTFKRPRLIRKYPNGTSQSPAVAVTWGKTSSQLFVGFKDGQICSYERPIRSGVRVMTSCCMSTPPNQR